MTIHRRDVRVPRGNEPIFALHRWGAVGRLQSKGVGGGGIAVGRSDDDEGCEHSGSAKHHDAASGAIGRPVSEQR